MSLVNLTRYYEAALLRAQLAEDQERELEELLAQWFIDSDEGARAFLREIAAEHREAHPRVAQIAQANENDRGCATT